jgi:hypothetical protein
VNYTYLVCKNFQYLLSTKCFNVGTPPKMSSLGRNFSFQWKARKEDIRTSRREAGTILSDQNINHFLLKLVRKTEQKNNPEIFESTWFFSFSSFSVLWQWIYSCHRMTVQFVTFVIFRSSSSIPGQDWVTSY